MTFVLGFLAAAAMSGAPVDPLTVQLESADADRFAALFERTDGRPTAEQLQRDYLDPGSYGVRVFTPHRIVSAAHLAATIAAHRDEYDRAIRVCLPIVRQSNAELRATYLALHGLVPERALPRMYLVVGARNSGGTAGPGAQVLGLETLCRISATPEQLRETLRRFYAHETVHTLQAEPDDAAPTGPLLANVLAEGGADFIATLVTGRQAEPERDAWARPREAELWRAFEADLVITRSPSAGSSPDSPASIALRRWIGNYGSAPAGWPGELGYWMGQRIWQRWYDRQSDKHAAIRAMLAMKDPLAVLQVGRFVGSN